MNNNDIDKSSDLHDEKISALYRQFPDETPSPDTDALIRAAARRAVGATPQKKLFTARVQGLLATAATLVLGVALVVQWRSEPRQLQEVLATAPVSPAPAASAARDSAAPAEAKKEAPAKLLRDKNVLPKPAPVVSDNADRMDGDEVDALAEAAPPAPEAMRAAEAESRARVMADALEKKSAAESSRKEARAAGAVQQYESLRSGARFDESPPQAAAAPASISAAAPQPGTAAEKVKTEISMPPYQQAMQAGHWAEAEKLLATANAQEASPQIVDRDLLARVQGKRRALACTALPEGSGDTLLCRLITQHSEGQTLPVDALDQLEKNGALAGPLAYRRAAILRLLEKP